MILREPPEMGKFRNAKEWFDRAHTLQMLLVPDVNNGSINALFCLLWLIIFEFVEDFACK